ncbi:MAG: hypothetical protein QOG80_3235, partial [Pseudonocardiales bacterium]|nr:hypothetical protein [Pseudonocardiales bacterium]
MHADTKDPLDRTHDRRPRRAAVAVVVSTSILTMALSAGCSSGSGKS